MFTFTFVMMKVFSLVVVDLLLVVTACRIQYDWMSVEILVHNHGIMRFLYHTLDFLLDLKKELTDGCVNLMRQVY